MRSLGSRLKAAREMRGVPLAHISRETRITKRYLEALERDDLDALPGGVFDTGYIRSYAASLDLDPDPFLEAYRAAVRPALEEGEKEDDASRSNPVVRADPRRSRTSGHTVLLLGIGAASLGVFLAATWGIFGAVVGSKAEILPERVQTSEIREETISAPTSTRTPPSRAGSAAESEMEDLSDSVPGPSVDSGSGLTVSSYGVGTGTRERNLVGRSEEFVLGTDVVFWTRVLGGEEGEHVRHVWLHRDQPVMIARLEIGGPHWRTYSRIRAPEVGNWVVEVRNEDGSTLARTEFVVRGDDREARLRHP